MAKHAPLTRLTDWELVHPEQDIRGWPVHDASGDTIGRVDDLLVSTDTELVEVIRLEDGEEYPAKDIEIGDGVVYLQGERPAVAEDEDEPVVKVYDETRVRRSEVPEGYAKYDRDFRQHYQTTYGTEEDYTLYEPAYRYGYTYGAHEDYAGRDYDALEPEIRRSYEERYGTGKYGRVSDAVRYGFTRSRAHSRTT